MQGASELLRPPAVELKGPAVRACSPASFRLVFIQTRTFIECVGSDSDAVDALQQNDKNTIFTKS
jgi:hypothetical protein